MRTSRLACTVVFGWITVFLNHSVMAAPPDIDRIAPDAPAAAADLTVDAPEEIWLCAGQSNMAFPVSRSAEAEQIAEEVDGVKLMVPGAGGWERVYQANVARLSAVAVAFATERGARRDTSVGICVAAKGGTSIDAWLPVAEFPDTEEGRRLKPLAGDPDVLKAAAGDAADFRPWGEHRLNQWGLGRAVPGSLFEELIRPLAGLPITGVIWYQGEANTRTVAQAREYRHWLESLISSWRALWKRDDLPFVIIQLPEFDPGTDESRRAWAELQNVQADVAASLPGVTLVEINDLGDPSDIHPTRKRGVGQRAAAAVAGLAQPDLP